MPPRKKPNSSSKKLNQNQQSSQASKFGIQHFFEKHTQNNSSQTHKKGPALPASHTNLTRSSPEILSELKSINEGVIPELGNSSSTVQKQEHSIQPQGNLVSGISAVENDKKGKNICPSQHTPPEKLLPISEVSPEICKSVSLKRFKFSPGMLIKQSQDDGVNEVTWKISPINDKLQFGSKHLPEVIKLLADSSRFNSTEFHGDSKNKISPSLPNSIENGISLCSFKAAKLTMVPKWDNLNNLFPGCNVDLQIHRNSNDEKIFDVTETQSPFKTPPSLSYLHEKVEDVGSSEPVDELGSKQYKKALLELLDQVEDVISIEESTSTDGESSMWEVNGKNNDGKPNETDPCHKSLPINLAQMEHQGNPLIYYLVLEVSDERGSVNSSAFQCCKVLRLLNEQSGQERVVRLWDEWFYSSIAPGDTLSVIGEFDEHGKCDVNHQNNYFIVHPDILVSGTRVASSFSCPRRTVLDERLKSSEQSVAALMGTLMHQVFQAGLMKEDPSREFLEDYSRQVLLRSIESLYACGVNENELRRTMIEAIPRILNWIHVFRDSQDSKASNVNFGFNDGLKKVNVSEVVDIEEMAWAPKYGLKGMIDASIRVMVKTDKNGVNEKIMPLELKTGKATTGQSAMEHRAQVMLYTLLMSERYSNNVDSGLLYYLHTDQTEGIMVRRSDLIGLIMRRNELANDILRASTSHKLPPVLQSSSMCKSCRHLHTCAIYQKAHGGSTESSEWMGVFNSFVQHLTSKHCAFLRQWERLIDLEAIEMKAGKKGIWCPPSPGENSADCLFPLVLDTKTDGSIRKSLPDSNKFVYRFVFPNLDSPSSAVSPEKTMHSAMRSGDYVLLSNVLDQLTVASGIIMDITPSHVIVSFSKRLRLPGRKSSSHSQDLRQEVWRIDKDESNTIFSIMRFNLIQLFLQDEHKSHLRKMIVDLEAPKFDGGSVLSQDPAISYIWSEKGLNNDQRRAIVKILTAKDYALILGMPGTGKTSTMVHAVKALLMRGASILLTSYTNSAVDNLLVKLKAQGIDFIRIGRTDAVHEEVRSHCLSEVTINSVEDLKQRLEQIRVVAVTCLGITNPLLAKKRFDVCIMDEAGQTTLPVALGPLMYASKFVLVGDHYQLPPLVKSTEARENGMIDSLFCRLSEAHPQAISALQSQYRMSAGIMELSNTLIYGDRLRCGSSEIETAKLQYKSSKYSTLWLKEVLNPNRPVIFINTDMLPALEVKDGKTVNNPIEACIVVEITGELVNKGVEEDHIGIITPYNSQANLISSTLSMSVEVHTIDKYQGRDKDCIVISFVRSSEGPRNNISSLLGDWHRINVALTRAKVCILFLFVLFILD
ncbi:DNA replication ATP-dependent helicase/nuclease JHS1 isoform X2 [Impatiens glandulifera]|uniref:DNA replication ATP-dependent helicase/nuclease JHS1 isoform X2 n=1 Tax=Impatiens glandulifera TaxID=253017 RepID=UPI001FB11821|nr:DNA replication ATP-dependent helicase/nuclease JHS1 isoform X2 [Impatiens glandulifera]